MRPPRTISLYWKCQIIGWSMAALYWGYAGYNGGGEFYLAVALLHFFTDVLMCLSITHAFRTISKKYSNCSFDTLVGACIYGYDPR
jgi:hypothetical protein